MEVEDINFYFNAIEALLNANTYYLEAYGLILIFCTKEDQT